MIRILTLSILVMISSCKKDELIPNNAIITPKVIEIKKEGPVPPKKRKFKLFKRKKYKAPKSCLQTY
jgi:hypothetical protein